VILPEQTRFTTGSAILITSEGMMETMHQKAGMNKNDEIMGGPILHNFG
jgi:hypothetical protein